MQYVGDMKKTVLFIEDDITLRENTRELLELSNFKVLTASNGKIGVKIARDKLPDIIISDIMMPELNGYQVFEALKEDPSTRNIPFIFMSVKREPMDIRKGMNLGADDYITKPFREEDLISSIESRLAKKEGFQKRNEKVLNGAEETISNLELLRSYFRNYGEYLEFEKNEEIYREGGHASYVYLVEEGLIKVLRLDEYGKELITWLSKKDDIMGFYSFKIPTQYPETAEALEISKLFRISSEEFIHTLLKSQELTVEFAQLISENLSVLKTHLLDMAYGSVLKKTTNTILEFAEKIQSDPKEYIRISRSDLASVAGISTESFIRSLSCLKKEGLIDIVGRDIKILNLQKLHTIR